MAQDSQQPPTKTSPQAQKTAVQPPGQGGLAQSMPAQQGGEDPEFQRKKQGWDKVLEEMTTKPGAASFLTSMGAGLMQPVEADQTITGNIGASMDRAQKMQQQLQQQQFQQEMEEQRQATQEQRVEQRGDIAEDRLEGQRERQQARFQREEKAQESRQEFKLDILDEEFQNKMDLAMDEAMLEATTGQEVDRQKLYTEIWDKVYKQAKADRLNLPEEEFNKKWGDSIQDDILASYRAALKHVGGRRAGGGEDKEVSEKVTVSGEFMQRAAEEQGVDPGQFDPGQSYQIDPEKYQELAGQPDKDGDPTPPTAEGEAGEEGQVQETGTTDLQPDTIQVGDQELQVGGPSYTFSDLGEDIQAGYETLNQMGPPEGYHEAQRFRRQLRQGRIAMPPERIENALPSLEGDERKVAEQILQRQQAQQQ